MFTFGFSPLIFYPKLKTLSSSQLTFAFTIYSFTLYISLILCYAFNWISPPHVCISGHTQFCIYNLQMTNCESQMSMLGMFWTFLNQNFKGFCISPLPTFVFPAHQFCISHREMTGAGRIPRCPKVKERDRGMPGTLSLSPTMHYYASSSSSSSSSPPPSPRPSPPIPLKISPRHHQHALSLHKKYQFCKTIPHT